MLWVFSWLHFHPIRFTRFVSSLCHSLWRGQFSRKHSLEQNREGKTLSSTHLEQLRNGAWPFSSFLLQPQHILSAFFFSSLIMFNILISYFLFSSSVLIGAKGDRELKIEDSMDWCYRTYLLQAYLLLQVSCILYMYLYQSGILSSTSTTALVSSLYDTSCMQDARLSGSWWLLDRVCLEAPLATVY